MGLEALKLAGNSDLEAWSLRASRKALGALQSVGIYSVPVGRCSQPAEEYLGAS